MKKLMIEVAAMASSIKFYDGKGHLAAVNGGEVTAFSAAVNGPAVILDGDIDGAAYATAFIEPEQWNSRCSGKAVAGTVVKVLAMAVDGEVKVSAAKKTYHDLKVVEILDVTIEEDPRVTGVLRSRGIAVGTIPAIIKKSVKPTAPTM